MSESTVTNDLPAQNDNKAMWVLYAIGQGMPQDEAEQYTKAQLIDLYTAEGDGDSDGENGENGDGSGNGEQPATPAARTRSKAPDTSGITQDAIESGFVSIGGGLAAAGAPVRERKPEQKLMDAVAEKAYREWVTAGRPSQWEKLPVVTYFLDDEELPKYRYLIRRACAIVEPDNGATGVTVRFGNEFTLSEKMATRLDPENVNGLLDHIGKNVLMWAAVDKRRQTGEN
jgi:hypothetical protein